MSDQVNPSHYKRFPDVEVIQITRHLDFDSGNAVKYICRAGHKEGQDELVDLQKAMWYLKDRIAEVERQREAEAASRDENANAVHEKMVEALRPTSVLSEGSNAAH